MLNKCNFVLLKKTIKSIFILCINRNHIVFPYHYFITRLMTPEAETTQSIINHQIGSPT